MRFPHDCSQGRNPSYTGMTPPNDGVTLFSALSRARFAELNLFFSRELKRIGAPMALNPVSAILYHPT